MSRVLRSCAAIMLAALAAGALAAPRRPPRGVPAWTRLRPGRCPVPFSPALLCAVGKVEGITSELGRSVAATRARTTLAEALGHARVIAARAPGGRTEERRETAVAATLPGSVILAIHRARGGVWYALAAIDGRATGGDAPP